MINSFQINSRNSLSDWFDSNSTIDITDQILNIILSKIPEHQRNNFLSPRISDIPSPFLLKNIDEAVSLFIEAVFSEKHIVIAGDYDVDGVTSVALLVRFFTILNYQNYSTFIPNRFQHGYGLNEKSVDALIALRPDLIITVDNGITAKSEISVLKKQGIEVIVTDHHTPLPNVLPECVIINPKLKDTEFPHDDISGVGVVFLFIIALRVELRKRGFWTDTIPEPNLLEHLDLVTLGTVADQVPLVGLNRLFVKFGFEQMTKKIQMQTPGPFFTYLKTFAQNNNTLNFSSDTINFKLAPLLNAAGRIKDASIALEFLMPSTNEDSLKSYLNLEKLNKTRKQLQQKQYLKAEKLAEAKVQNRSSLVIYDPDFHEGLVGIIANRLSDKYHIPAIVLTESEEGKIKGSCRSKYLDILQMLELCAPLLIQFGGHSKAAGCSLKLSDLEKFEQLLDEKCRQNTPESIANNFLTDIELKSEMVTPELVDKIKLMEPFGQGNPKPYFMFTELDLSEPVLLSGKHLKWNLNHQLEIVFWEGQRYFKQPGNYQLACSLKDNTYRGTRKAQLVVRTMNEKG